MAAALLSRQGNDRTAEHEILRQFSRQAWRAFLLSLSIYLLSILAVCIAIAVDLHLKHSSIPVALLVAETCLGCIFFVGLVASTCARMNVALAGSTVGAIIYALLFLSQRQLTGSFGPAAAQTSCCIALGTAMVFLVLGCKARFDQLSATSKSGRFPIVERYAGRAALRWMKCHDCPGVETAY